MSDVKAFCEHCGSDLGSWVTCDDGLVIPLCDTCYATAEDRGYRIGHNAAEESSYNNAYEKGHEEGYEQGFDDGANSGGDNDE